MAGPSLNSPSELAAYLETVRQRQRSGSEWPADYMFRPADGGGLTIGVTNAQGQVENYSVWLKRDQPGGAFNSVILLNTQAQFDALYRSRPDADKPNTVEFGNKKAWVNSNTGEVRPADVSEVFYIPGSGKIVPADQRLDYYWSQSGEAVNLFDAERMIARHESQIRNLEIPAGTKLTQSGKGELVKPLRAFVNSDVTKDGVLSASDLATDLRSKGFAYEIPGTLVQTPDSQKKAAADQILISAFARAREALPGSPSATTSLSAVNGVSSVGVYQPIVAVASASAGGVAQSTPVVALNPASFMAEVQKLGTITSAQVGAAKDDKNQMRAASRAISDINTLLSGDATAQKPETQARILEALKASPGQSDIIADFVRKKISNPSMDINEHSGMVTGRLLGVRPALESVASVTPEFTRSASPSPGGVLPKNLAELGILPTGTDLAEDYNRAKDALTYIRNSLDPKAAPEDRLNPQQTNALIQSWKSAGYGSYAGVMEDMRQKVVGGANPTTVLAQSKVALNSAYSAQYEQKKTVNIQGDAEQGRERALKHLAVDYNNIRSRIPDILREQYGNMSPEQQKTIRDKMVSDSLDSLAKQGQTITPALRSEVERSIDRSFDQLKSGQVTEEQKNTVMSAVQSAINQIADSFARLTPARQAEIERTINERIAQAVSNESAKRLSNVDVRVTEAQDKAQAQYDERTKAFIEQVKAMPPEQQEKLCANSASNPLVQAACKP